MTDFSLALLSSLTVLLLEVAFPFPWACYVALSVLFVLRSALKSGMTSTEFIIIATGLVLFVFPHLGELLRENYLSMWFYSLYFWVALVMTATLGDRRSLNIGCGSIALTDCRLSFETDSVKIFVLLAASLLGARLWPPIFPGLFGIALVIFGRQCRARSVKGPIVATSLAMILIAIGLYVSFVWNTFGRLLILTFILTPVGICAHYGRIKIRQSYLYALAPVGFIYGAVVRGADEVGLSTLAGGSASHPLILQDELLKGGRILSDFDELFGQYLLFFFSWVPRFVWPTKPYGAGWTFVDTYIGREGVSDGHSIALGLWGEHLYMNPGAWLLTGFLTLGLFVAQCRYFTSKGGDFLTVGIIFQCNVLTLVWGGMASFGARAWWLVIPAAVYCWSRRRS